MRPIKEFCQELEWQQMPLFRFSHLQAWSRVANSRKTGVVSFQQHIIYLIFSDAIPYSVTPTTPRVSVFCW